MSVTVARFAEIAPTPWKNGLGTTTQLAIHPPGASTDAFGWRLSIAELTTSAPFSSFAHIERILAVLEGELTLHIVGMEPVKLTADSAPLAFSGEVAAEGHIAGGTVRDLNLMYDPTRWRATMRRTREPVLCNATTLLCALMATSLRVDDEPITLARFDVLAVVGVHELAVVAADVYEAHLHEVAA